MIHQPFDINGDFLCVGCNGAIGHEQFYVEIRQRDLIDSDTRLAVHIGCLIHPSRREAESIEMVAKAICASDTLAIGWEMQDVDGKARFRRMAQSAIDASSWLAAARIWFAGRS